MRFFGSRGFASFQYQSLGWVLLWKAGGVRFKRLYLMVITPLKSSLQNCDGYAKFMPNKTQTAQKEIAGLFLE